MNLSSIHMYMHVLYTIGSKGESEIPQAVVKEGFDLSELKRSFNPHVGHVQSPTIVLIGWNLGVCKASIM